MCCMSEREIKDLILTENNIIFLPSYHIMHIAHVSPSSLTGPIILIQISSRETQMISVATNNLLSMKIIIKIINLVPTREGVTWNSNNNVVLLLLKLYKKRWLITSERASLYLCIRWVKLITLKFCLLKLELQLWLELINEYTWR